MAQLIISSYPLPLSMLSPGGINHNKLPIFPILIIYSSLWILFMLPIESLTLCYTHIKFIQWQSLANLGSSSKRVTTIPLNFGTVLANANGPFMTQLMKKQRNLILLLFSHVDLYGIFARNESVMIFSTNGRYLSKHWMIKDETF